jgi:hypothetical protein
VSHREIYMRLLVYGEDGLLRVDRLCTLPGDGLCLNIPELRDVCGPIGVIRVCEVMGPWRDANLAGSAPPASTESA